LLGRFHGALADFDWRYPAVRTGVHDLDRHLRNLRAAVERHRTHARAGAIVPLARDILAAAAALTRLPEFPPRVAHGDPKISNVIFGATDDNARCLVDLDTVGPLPWVLELGDAFRSWCNPAGEDGRAGRFDLDLFRAAVSGYAGEAGRRLDARERDRIVTATETIFVELAARFCADALEESYFGWDPARYPTRSEHNEVRAAGQLAAARALARVRRDADAIVAAAFAAPA
jgi:Ser/Thr protein kinase RdoA (MazF antagonist)